MVVMEAFWIHVISSSFGCFCLTVLVDYVGWGPRNHLLEIWKDCFVSIEPSLSLVGLEDIAVTEDAT